VTRHEALAVAADIIARSVPDLGLLLDLLEVAGQKRLVAAIMAHLGARPAEVGGTPRPDAALWLSGRVR
jgi:hypothetical protein